VDIDVLGLSQKIHEVFPAENVHIDTSKDVVIITGKISSSVVADKILEVGKRRSTESTQHDGSPAALTADLAASPFAEVDRTARRNSDSTSIDRIADDWIHNDAQFGGSQTWNLNDTFPVRGPQGNPSETFSTNPDHFHALNIFC